MKLENLIKSKRIKKEEFMEFTKHELRLIEVSLEERIRAQIARRSDEAEEAVQVDELIRLKSKVAREQR